MGYVCKFCGHKSSSPSFAGQHCSKSPTKKHVIISEQKEYVCKYCGHKSSSPSFAGNYCSKSPYKIHELME